MKTPSVGSVVRQLCLLALLLNFNAQFSISHAQGIGTAFTYQGRLNANGQSANGLYDLRFRLATDALGNNYVPNTILLNAQPITNGLFTAALDFGAGTFTGTNLWLEVDVRTNGGGGYTTLNPLQPLTPAPYAIMAATASSIFATNIVGSISLTQLPGSVLTNNESDPVSFNGSLSLPAPATVYSGAALLLRSDPPNRNFFAGGAGNLTLSGTFNTADGYSSMKNTTTGSSNTASGSYTLFHNTTGSNNTANGSYALFSNAAGGDNTANGYYAMSYNTDGGYNTAVGRTALLYNTNGNFNTALGACALYYLGGGTFNTAIGESALGNLQSGVGNIGIGYYAGAWLTNGHDNIYIGDNFINTPGNPNETNVMRLGRTQKQTFIAGVINGNGGGLTNVPFNLPASVLTNNATAVTLDGSFSGNGSGLTNVNAATLGGSNSSGFWKTGGNIGTTAGLNFLGTADDQPLELKVNGIRALRLEAQPNTYDYSNIVNVIGGSPVNFVAPGTYGATIGGGGGIDNFNGLMSSNTVSRNFGTVGGGLGNISSGFSATIGGGQLNTAGGYVAVVVGGTYNNASGDESMVGGHANTGSGRLSFVGGGLFNVASGFGSFVGGGGSDGGLIVGNVAAGGASFIGGGVGNTTPGYHSVVVGGRDNHATNDFAMIPGGQRNTAGGHHSFAAGYRANALHNGGFVWADSSQDADFASTAPNQLLIRASGGVGIGTASPAAHLHLYSADNPTIFRIQSSGTPGFGRIEFVSDPQSAASQWRPGYIQSTDNGSFNGGLGFFVNGAGTNFGSMEVMRLVNGNVGIGITNPTNKLHVAGGVSATAFVSTSDRNAKENFTAISPRDVLAKVAALPITEWNFKEMPGLRHMGPMAQDFYAAFGLGGSDTTITSVDPDGVAFAAIQGLNAKVEKQGAELKQKETEITELRKELAELKTQRLEHKETEITELKLRLEKIERLMTAQK